MRRPNAASLIVLGFSLGLFASAHAGTLGSSVFPDVTGGTYFDSAVGEMNAAGIITGYENGKFGPNDFVTRGQVAVMMQRLKASLSGEVSQSSSSRRSITSSSSSSSSSSSTSTSHSTVDPTNDSAGSFRFTTGSFKAEEGSGEYTINVIRYGGNEGVVTVEYELTKGTATANDDYTAVTGKLTFPNGITTAKFTIPILDDKEAEDTETILLTLKNPTGGAGIGAPNVATLSILDNDEGDGSTVDTNNANGVFVFSANKYEMAENINTITITVNRTSGTQGEATVSYETSNGTADSSYYESVSGTLTFASGESTKTFAISVKDNNDTNGNKTVNLKLTKPTGGATLGSLSTAVLSIIDNEISPFGIGKIRQAEEAIEAYEGTPVFITINRLGGSKGEVSVAYETVNALAKAGEDYTETKGTLTFKDGESQKIIVIPILNDSKNDPHEGFRFKLSSPTGGATIETPAESVITIE